MADALDPLTATAAASTELTHDGLWSPARRTLTLGLVLTITLVAFEALAVSTIMPNVARELGDLALYGWVFTAFFLGSLLGIVFVGGLIDRGGLVRPFIAGLALFSIGLVIGGLAPSMPVLVAARFLQGLGGGAIPPIAYVSIGRALPETLRPRMFATMSTAWVLPGVIGPALSGIVADNVGWRAVFLGLLPLILLAGAMTLPAMAASIPAADRGPGNALAATRQRFPAAILVAVGAGLVVTGLGIATLLTSVPLIIGGLAIGIPAFRRLTPPGTLRVAAGLPAAVLLRGLLTFAFFCADVYVPRALVDWRGLSVSVAGIALTAATLAWTGGAWVQARRFTRWGARRFVRLGYLTVALGILGFGAVLSPDVPVIVGIVTWGIAGFGMGLAYSPLSLTVLAEAPLAEQGSATSGLQLSDVVGTALGTGIGGAIIAAAITAGWPGWAGFAGAFAVGVGAALVGALLAVRLPGPRAGAGEGQRSAAALDFKAATEARRRARPTRRVRRPMSAKDLRAKIREIPDFPKPGILFYDITTLLKDPASFRESIDLMLKPYKDERIDIVVGMESRGFIFSAPMAYLLKAGLVPVRKLGKLPAETITVEYALEYGSNTLEIHRDSIQAGQRVLIVDDLLATGGTVRGTIELVERLKGVVVGLAFLVELDFLKGRELLEGRRVTSVVTY